jgi:hypothetical protein
MALDSRDVELFGRGTVPQLRSVCASVVPLIVENEAMVRCIDRLDTEEREARGAVRLFSTIRNV